MDRRKCNAVASNSKNLALSYIKSKNFGRAFSHFLIALKLEPEWKIRFKEPFSSVLFQWGTALENSGQYNDLFNCYEQAIEVFPDNEYILNNLGAILMRHGLLKEAAHYFRKSLNIRPEFLRPLRNLENVSNLVVPRWHFRMLNDSKRNSAFREAINRKVHQGFDVVLDIGTGTGILSLFALEAGAKKITSCDSSSFMIEIAGQVIQENNANSIELIDKHSRDLKIPDDLSDRVSLVVTEILDCGLFGENVLETVTDAWDRLLLPPSPDSTSSASSGVVIPFGAFIYVTGVECDYLRKKHKFTNNSNECFNFSDCYIKCNEEIYDSECLKRIPNGYRNLTNVYKTFFINFNDRERMGKILSGEFDEYIELNCFNTGRLDCLVVWFDLYVDENIVLSTSPDSESSDSWDQAIFPVPNNFNIAKDDKISVRLSFKDGKIAFYEFTLNSNLKLESNIFDAKVIFNLSEDLIQLLNSDIYANIFTEMGELIGNKFKRDVSILDTFPFPIFGLNWLIRNIGNHNILKTVVRNENDRNFLKYCANKYNLEDRVKFVEEEELFAMHKNEKYDIVLINFVERHGELKDKMITLLSSIRSHLKPDGLLIPERVTIMGQLIESEWLQKMSHIVNDHVTFGYKIGKIINSYKVNTHIDFDVNAIDKIFRSEPFEICSVVTGQFNYNLHIPLVQSGNLNALAVWFHIKFINEGPEISTLNDQITSQTALLFPKIFVTDWIELKIIYDNGLLKIENL